MTGPGRPRKYPVGTTHYQAKKLREAARKKQAQNLEKQLEQVSPIKSKTVSKTANALDKVLQDRGSQYGSYEKNAMLTNSLIAWFRTAWTNSGKKHLPPAYVEETVHMIFHKISRIANGDHKKMDSWIDIAGYAQLVVNILKEGSIFGDKATEIELEQKK